MGVHKSAGQGQQGPWDQGTSFFMGATAEISAEVTPDNKGVK